MPWYIPDTRSYHDWMNAHHFVDGVEVQRLCLTLLGVARLWYQSLQPINVDWQGLQNLFRQQYSKIGNTREQLCRNSKEKINKREVR